MQKIIEEKNGDKEMIQLALNELNELQKRKTDSEKINTLWLAKELDYIPVKLTQTENGRTTFNAELRDLIK